MGEMLLAEPLLWLIGAAEIGFWLFLAAGLAARYLLRRTGLGAALLLGVPLMDVVLIVAATADIASGGEPSRVHGLAAVYLGVTVAFGHSLVRWADARFAHRFAGGPRPVRPPRGGRARMRYEWREFGKVVLAWVIAAGVLCLLTVVGGRGIPELAQWPADPMWAWLLRVSTVAAIWFVAGPLWATVLPGADDRERDRVRA
ncbi:MULTISPECIES: hypothetical protein [Pseudonocardia]|uniref:Membrane protein YmcC n=2 Tax=Pseudonocardia TaxID=1847 RepID=A0A1Y2N977_PSEAH|nr:MULTISPECIES: hypothetical protein [Pseudonocardia]OSY44020.1 hypothetical protein BG845_00140 [Pseudonocardia autotrophica]TDN74248.1 hypothetical protein C8E95_3366 [Pseudonocardia autotrophica]BBG05011.1 hypothetical protein Pdca_62200 [Pseudonocardia autotrophica]GEC28345.1 hypothetical protein PSA01_53740 [Pseudonocardia saturnea]